MGFYRVEGTIESVNVKGRGPNSAQLLFTVKNASGTFAFVVTSYPDYEPQMFTAMVSFALSAYQCKQAVSVSAEESFPTDKAFEIGMPPWAFENETRPPLKHLQI